MHPPLCTRADSSLVPVRCSRGTTDCRWAGGGAIVSPLHIPSVPCSAVGALQTPFLLCQLRPGRLCPWRARGRLENRQREESSHHPTHLCGRQPRLHLRPPLYLAAAVGFSFWPPLAQPDPEMSAPARQSSSAPPGNCVPVQDAPLST